MAEITLDELIARTRLESGLRENAYYDADQIIRYLNAGGSELYDLFTQANQKYNIAEFDFTAAGQADAIVELPDDFQQGHSLDIYPDTPGQTRTIRYLSNWLNRNSFGNNVFSLGPAGFDPVYTFLDNKLRFYPPQCTPSAPFRLFYTPMWKNLATPTTPPARTVDLETGVVAASIGRWTFPAVGTLSDSDRGATFTVSGATNPGNDGAKVILGLVPTQEAYTVNTGLVNETFGVGDSASIQQLATSSRTFEAATGDVFIGGLKQFNFANAGFTDSDVGAVMTIDFSSPNTSFNGEYTILTVLSGTSVVVSTEQTSSLTVLPGQTATIFLDRRQVGTLPALPERMGSWSEYLVAYAAIAINTDRQRGTGELERKLNALKARITSILDNRQEEPIQPPLTRGIGGWGGGWDGGWW